MSYPSAPGRGTSPNSLSSTYYDMGSANKGQCTWYAHGRAAEMRGNLGAAAPRGNGSSPGGYNNANTWDDPGYYGGHWSATSNWSDVRVGDLVVFDADSSGGGPGHVAVVESKSGDTGYLSSFNGGRWAGGAYNELSLGTIAWSVGSNFNGWSNAVFSGYLINHIDVVDGSGGGENPDEPPDPKPGGHYVWVEETITIVTTGGYDYTGNIYECGTGTFGDQSGTQDTPQAPHKISSSTSRINQRWEPFIMYTDERTLTYTPDGKPVWSNWETKYTGQDNFPLGSQPTYGNGWEMEWRGDDD